MPNLIGSSFGHEHSTPPIGFATEPVSKSKTHKYNVRIKVTRTHTHKWNRVIEVVDSPELKTHKYNILSRVSVTKTHRYNAGGKVRSRLKTHKFNIIEKITKSKTHKYTVTVLVDTTKTHKFNIIERIVATKTHIYTSGGKVKNIFKLHKYDIKQGITRTYTHKWNILTPKILTSDLEYYKSISTNSLGGAIDTNTLIVHNTIHNLFDVITATESQNGDTEYRCIYVKNTTDRSLLGNSKIWIETNTINNENTIVTIGLGTSAIGGEEQTIATEETTPTDVSFSSADGFANALTIGDLTHGQHKAVWLKRVISPDSPAYDSDNFTIGFCGDTLSDH